MTLIIGDIHGCYDELQALLDRAGIAADEPVIALGDIVDRGPASPQVLAFFQNHPHARSLMGNHERKHVRAVTNRVKLAASQRIARQQFLEQGFDYEAALAFMAALPLYIDLPHALLVHGYLEPGVPPQQQRANVLAGTMTGEKFLSKRYDRPWFEQLHGDKPVVVGHREYAGGGEPFVYRDRIYGLDTGCYRGKRLTGLLLPAFRFVSVKSARNYWLDMRRHYPEQLSRRPRPVAPEKLPWERLQQWAAAADGRQEWVQRAAEAQATFPAIWAWATSEHLRILDTLPGFDDLPPKKQGRRYDKAINDLPGPVRRLLHRVRQDKLPPEKMSRALRSLADVDAVLQHIKSNTCLPGKDGKHPHA